MLDRLALAVMAIAWLVPNHYAPWSSFYNECCAVVGLLLLAKWSPPQSRFSGAPVAAVCLVSASAIVLLQWGVGQVTYSGDAWVSILYLAAVATAVIVGHQRAGLSGERFATALSVTLVVGGLISALIALTQGFGLSVFGDWVESAPPSRPFANLGQPNNLATLLGLAAVSVLFLYERHRIGLGATAALLLPIVTSGALTQSRTALLYGPLVLLTLVVVRRRGVAMRAKPSFVAGVCALHWALAASWPFVLQTLLLSANLEQSLSQRGVGSLRFQLWPLLYDALLQSPWFGFGWLQVGAAQLSVANAHAPVGELWLHGHNLFLELLVWCGLPVGLLLCGVLLYWFCSRWIMATSIEAVVGMLSVTIFALHAMLELPHHYLYFLVPIGLWIGQLERWARAPVLARSQWSYLPQLVVLVLSIGISKDYLEIEEDFRLVRFESMRIGPQSQSASTPTAPMLSGLTSFLRFARTEPVRGLNSEQLNSMEATVRRYPYSSSLYRLGIALALNGRQDEARERFINVRHMFGENAYRGVRASLALRIEEGGAPELIRLQMSLPD